MIQEIPSFQIEFEVSENKTVAFLQDCIEGANPFYHGLVAGSELELCPGNYHRIVILIEGSLAFSTDGNDYIFHERVSFVPNPKHAITLKAITNTQVLEIRWDLREGDDELLREYEKQYPQIQVYRNSKQYKDRNKSEKTISRAVIWQRNIPRFALGSVEAYGDDIVKPHAHPMLDQFFFTFSENEMDVELDSENIHLKGNVFLYIPLGAMHGVNVKIGEHCHYLWFDFYPDNELALKRLDTAHIGTGQNLVFNEKGELVQNS